MFFVTFCPGTVSWDEFISFMLCQDQGASIIAEESGRAQFQLPVQIEPAMRCTGHEESIVRVMVRRPLPPACRCNIISSSPPSCRVTRFVQILDGATDKYLSWTNDGFSFLWSPVTEPVKPPVALRVELPFVTDVARVEAVSA